jgi:hypothetical protein
MWLVYLVCTVLAAIRIGGDKSEIFQALAHLWMGALIAVWFLNRDLCRPHAFCSRAGSQTAGRLVVVLSIVEVLCFIASKVLSA